MSRPPFTALSASPKARLAEDARGTRDPARVVLAATHDGHRRNRSEFFTGRGAIAAFLRCPWQVELAHPGLRALSR